jgi:hypothetical protein
VRPQVAYVQAIAAIMRERKCSAEKAAEVYHQRQLERAQEAFRSFAADVQASARTFEQVARTLPQRQRGQFLDAPVEEAVEVAIRHKHAVSPAFRVFRDFTPRQRRSCERRPRARTSRATRAGPSDPDEPEPPRRGLCPDNQLEAAITTAGKGWWQ